MTSSVALPALADTNPNWLTLRPDVQYISEPGAFSGEDIDNALVVGLQVKATF